MSLPFSCSRFPSRSFCTISSSLRFSNAHANFPVRYMEYVYFCFVFHCRRHRIPMWCNKVHALWISIAINFVGQVAKPSYATKSWFALYSHSHHRVCAKDKEWTRKICKRVACSKNPYKCNLSHVFFSLHGIFSVFIPAMFLEASTRESKWGIREKHTHTHSDLRKVSVYPDLPYSFLLQVTTGAISFFPCHFFTPLCLRYVGSYNQFFNSHLNFVPTL